MTTEGKLSSFEAAGTPSDIEFVQTMPVKEGVECDVYTFVGDATRDLGIVRVAHGFKTPLQRVLQGTTTIEGYVDGEGSLTVTDVSGKSTVYEFGPSTELTPVTVNIGETMQWHATGDTGLTFYEICDPPYEDGRFENLPE